MKGIILAAGRGTRLSPITIPTSKILLPVYDKPMAYYPLQTLIKMGIDDVLIISSQSDLDCYNKLFGNGSQFGISISYTVQPVQRGIADALIVAKTWINGEKCVLILGDNLFLGNVPPLPDMPYGACAYATHVLDPWRFGIAEVDQSGAVLSITEKPPKGTEKSDIAIVGLYLFDQTASARANELKPSKRGELEITDLNKLYLEENTFSIRLLEKDVVWIDAGTFDSLLEQSTAVKTIQKTSGKLIGSPEIAALEMGLVTPEDVLKRVPEINDNLYWTRVKQVCEDLIGSKSTQ